MKTKTILKCEHGSHLYGLATPESDHDYYEIYDFLNHRYRPKKQSIQTIDGDQDELRISLDRYEHLCYMGVPQAVEVLFSPTESWIEVTDDWRLVSRDIKRHLCDHMPKVLDTYRRTAMNFYLSKKDSEKKQRCAFRLVFNAGELKKTGHMNSRLTGTQIIALETVMSAWDREEIFKDLVFDTFGGL